MTYRNRRLSDIIPLRKAGYELLHVGVDVVRAYTLIIPDGVSVYSGFVSSYTKRRTTRLPICACTFLKKLRRLN
jgi:hypothetical protein